jgi:F-type H+-transporting ATPase subunit epsilon
VSVLQLQLRTPHGLVVDQAVLAITAEDKSGWFGIGPGRADLVAVLPPGLLTFRDAAGEVFVALAGGLLEMQRGRCRVLAREAVISRNLDEIADQLESHLARRNARREAQLGVMDELVREALQRMAEEVRS